MSAQLTDPKPFLLTDEKAVDIIERALRRRARMVRFPWILGAVSRVAAVLPRPLMSPLIRAVTSERSALPEPQAPAAPRSGG
jgi:hypothetical protein